MIGRVDHESLDSSDFSVGRVDVLPAVHLHLSFWYAVLSGRLGAHAHPAHAHAHAQAAHTHSHAAHAHAAHAHAAHAHAAHAAHTHSEREQRQREHLPLAITPLPSGSLQEMCLLGLLKRVKLGHRAPQADLFRSEEHRVG